MTSREEIVAALDDYLDIRGIHDSSLNGLQVEGADSVERVALAVDAAQATIDAAAENECQMLIIHHGLFWGPQVALTGMMGRRVRAAFDAGLSVYAAHLPLDAHQEVGNNVLLAQRLGGVVDGTFGAYEGTEIGTLASLAEPTDIGGLAGRLAAAGCDESLIWSFGGDQIRLRRARACTSVRSHAIWARHLAPEACLRACADPQSGSSTNRGRGNSKHCPNALSRRI